MIIYCQSAFAGIIRSIREDYHLIDQTEIVVIDDIFSVEPELYRRMRAIEKDEAFSRFRYYERAMSNTAAYDYIMLMKYWCLADAARKTSGDCYLAWIDFGFNHGGKLYTDSNDFDFLWEYDFGGQRSVYAFCLKDPTDVSVIDSLQFQFDCFMGTVVVVEADYCETFWQRIKAHMVTLLDIGCIDDDQFLLLMDYKNNPEAYNIRICDWFDVFRLCSNHSFSTRKSSRAMESGCSNMMLDETKKNLCSRGLYSFRKTAKKIIKRCKYQLCRKKDTKHYNFLRRMEEKSKKYYG